MLIPLDLREMLKLVPGDEMTMFCEGDILIMARARREHIIDRAKLSQIFDKLFPDKVEANG